MTGIDLLKMAQEGKLKPKTIVKALHERQYSDDRFFDYYIYQNDNMFHRCNENGKLGSKYQDRFLNYKTLSKSFEIYKIIEEPDLFEMIDDYKKPNMMKKLNTSIISASRYDYERSKEMTISNIAADFLSIAHKVNEIINYLQYKEKKDEQED